MFAGKRVVGTSLGKALATGGNFYDPRQWGGAHWSAARDASKAQNEKDRAAREV